MKRGPKKAQITLFIIIAILIIVISAIFLYINKINPNDKELLSSPEVTDIKESVLSCIETVSKDSLEIIGIQGGYYGEPEEFFELGWSFIPYYYKNQKILLPSKITIETELEKYVNDNFIYCLNELRFEDINISYKTPETQVLINQNEVLFNIDLSITIEKQNKKVIFETNDFRTSVNSKLFEMYEIAEYITNSHNEDPNMICLSCIIDMANERKLYVDMLEFSDEESITQIVISTNKTATYPTIFEFLNKYENTTTE